MSVGDFVGTLVRLWGDSCLLDCRNNLRIEQCNGLPFGFLPGVRILFFHLHGQVTSQSHDRGIRHLPLSNTADECMSEIMPAALHCMPAARSCRALDTYG